MDKWFNEKFERSKVREPGRVSQKRNLSRKFSITGWLIIINVLVYLAVFVLVGSFGDERIFDLLALKPALLFGGNFWTLLTSMFLHGGIGHLLANTVSLFFVGSFLEKVIGRKRFLWFYILAGLFAGLFYASLSFLFGGSGIWERLFVNPDVFAVGASGAIFGLLGVLAVLIPNNKIYLIAGPIIAVILQFAIMAIFPSSGVASILGLIITAYWIFSFFAIFSFNRDLLKWTFPLEMPIWILPIAAIVPLMIVGLFIELPIGNTAHLGGLIAGLIYGNYLKNKYKRKTAMLNRMFRG